MPARLYPAEIDENAANSYVLNRFKDTMHVKRVKAEQYRQQRSAFYHVKNGYNDPLSNALVLDLLTRLKPDQVLRAGNLTPQLEREYPQIAWDNYTVGRIMGNLAVFCKSQGFDYVEMNRDYLGRYMTVDPTPESMAWLIDLRERVGQLAHEAVIASRRGEKLLRVEDPLTSALAA